MGEPDLDTGVAVVGMAAFMPGAPDLARFWHNIVNGVDAITDAPADRWDPIFYNPASTGTDLQPDRFYCRRGGFIENAAVDVLGFGMPPTAVAATEPDQLIALMLADAAFTDAGGEDAVVGDRDRVGVVLGRGGYSGPLANRLADRVRGANQFAKSLGEIMPELGAATIERIRVAYADSSAPWRVDNAVGLVSNYSASRIANRLDLRGPAYTVDAACASSLIAVSHAVDELLTRRCDLMVAGAVHHVHDVGFWSAFHQLRALSPSQRIRPFDRSADGTLMGEGSGVVVLERLADARRAGRRIYAVIRGIGSASDGRVSSLLNPHPSGQIRAVRQAWRMAGLDPAQPGSVGLIEAHGTATPTGDSVELTSLGEVFGPADRAWAVWPGESQASRRMVLGSVKSMIGHTMPTAGIAGMIKAALAVYHGVLPPTLHCADPNPKMEQTRFEAIGSARPWITDPGQPLRRAAVNSFGLGGINSHVVLEQAPAQPVRVPAAPVAGRRRSGRPVPLVMGAPLVSIRSPEREEIQALVRARSAPTAGPAPAAGPVPGPRSASAGPAGSGSARALARPRPAVTVPPPRPVAPVPTADADGFRSILQVSTTHMPYLRDHSFLRQRPGWPEEEGHLPVVPGTTTVRHMMDAAAAARPPARAVAVHDARLLRWVPAAPAMDVPVTVTPLDAARATVRVGERDREHATAVVVTAADYPARRPAVWQVDVDAEREPDDSAAEMYRKRMMFHGPQFQCVTELTGIGERHARGVVRAGAVPGIELDGAGQIFAYWVAAMMPGRSQVAPAGFDRIEFFGPPPRPGSRVACHVRVRSVTGQEAVADLQLVVDAQVWAEVTGWRDKVFNRGERTDQFLRRPEYELFGERHGAGWVVAFERWRDLATRQFLAAQILGAAERPQFHRLDPREVRHWLLTRLAAKDAMRAWLWEQSPGPVFPAEIAVTDGPDGRLRPAGAHGRRIPALDVATAVCREAAVAIAGPVGGPPVGIAIDEVAGVATADQPDVRLVAERLAASLGTDRPVRWTLLANPEPLPPRTYVVAWHGGADHGGADHGDVGVHRVATARNVTDRKAEVST